MKSKDNHVLICDCEGTIPLDKKALEKVTGGSGFTKATQLCRRQLDIFENAIENNSSITLACTQEAPMFMSSMEERDSVPPVTFVNIREKAGWSKEGIDTAPKIAALLAEATLEFSPTKIVSMHSDGELLILGDSQAAVDAADKLSSRLSVTLILEVGSSVLAPTIDSYPIFSGKAISGRGHLGDFEVDLESVLNSNPSSKEKLAFNGLPRTETTLCDLILDLRDKSLFIGRHKRAGYFNPSKSDLVAVAMSLLDLSDMVGTYDKPQFIEYNPDICAHSRSQIVGCNKCIDNCSAGAISTDGDHVKFDPYICEGCGDCASVCPTGAASYQMPTVDSILTRQRTLISKYFAVGGKYPVLLIHDQEYGEEMIVTLARYGQGLPARVIPFTLNSTSSFGLESALAAIAYGATQVQILVGQKPFEELSSIRDMVSLANHMLSSLGYGEDRIEILDNPDPDGISTHLYSLPKLSKLTPASFLSDGDKRAIVYMALSHMNKHAPTPQEQIELPQGAPFGTLEIDLEKCTLCLACVGSCPTNALQDSPDKPQLKFRESACVQCGLCAKTCPEKVITLQPRIDLSGEARRLSTLKEEEPFECIECGKEFGTKATIERMIDKLKDHDMFAQDNGLDRLKMCNDCRVIALSNTVADPFKGGERPPTKTTDDYLREREEQRKNNKLVN